MRGAPFRQSPWHVPQGAVRIRDGWRHRAKLRSLWLPAAMQNRGGRLRDLAGGPDMAIADGGASPTSQLYAWGQYGPGLTTYNATNYAQRRDYATWRASSVGGGHLPATLLYFGERPTSPTNANTTGPCFFVGGPAVRPVMSAYTSFPANTLTAVIALNSSSFIAPTFTAPGRGHPFMLAITTRSATDHECALVNLKTGYQSFQTSATNLGSAAADTAYELVGQEMNASNALSTRGEFMLYMAAFLEAPLTRGEILEWMNDPFLMLEEPAARSVYRIAGKDATLTETLAAATLSAKASNINANLATTLAAGTLTGKASNINAALSVTLAAATLEGEGSIPLTGAVEVTLADSALAFGAVQVGPGMLGELAETLDDTSLDGLIEADVIGTLGETLAGATLAAYATTTVGGAARRRPSLSFY